MLSFGARFSEDMYIKTDFDPDSGDCVVTVETVIDDTLVTIAGEVVWDDGSDDGEGLG